MCAVPVAIEKLGLCAFNRTLRLTSFGFQHGTPRKRDTDIMIDACNRPIFHMIHPLHDFRDLKSTDVLEIIDREMDTMSFFKNELRVNIGCEFGKRESVDMVRWLESRTWREGWYVKSFYRDL